MELNNVYFILKFRRLQASEPMDLAGRGPLYSTRGGGQGVCQWGSSFHRHGTHGLLSLPGVGATEFSRSLRQLDQRFHHRFDDWLSAPKAILRGLPPKAVVTPRKVPVPDP
jgi:hypothetical protein